MLEFELLCGFGFPVDFAEDVGEEGLAGEQEVAVSVESDFFEPLFEILGLGSLLKG